MGINKFKVRQYKMPIWIQAVFLALLIVYICFILWITDFIELKPLEWLKSLLISQTSLLTLVSVGGLVLIVIPFFGMLFLSCRDSATQIKNLEYTSSKLEKQATSICQKNDELMSFNNEFKNDILEFKDICIEFKSFSIDLEKDYSDYQNEAKHLNKTIIDIMKKTKYGKDEKVKTALKRHSDSITNIQNLMKDKVLSLHK